VTENVSAADEKTFEIIVLCGRCQQLNSQRIELDRRIIGLHSNDPSFEVFWQELANVLVDLGDAVGRLAQLSSPHLTDLRSKASVLAILISSISSNGPVISDHQTRALALSLANDITSLPR
jgi:hypothetical protein